MTKSENLQRTVILTAAVVLATSAIGQGAPGARASADVPRPSLYLPLDAAALTAFPTAHVHVTVRGTPVFVEGRRGQALAVDARGAWLELAGTNLVDPEQGTIAFWMRPLDSPHPGASRRTFLSLLAPQNPDCAHFVGLYPDGSAYFLTEKDGVWLDSHFNFAWWKQPAWSTNIWHHLAVTWGTNQPVTFFVNGAKVFEQLNSRQSFSSQNAPIGRLVVGANGSGADLADAALDDIAIYRDTLTAAQLQRLMTEGPGDPATFVAYASVAPTAARTPQPAAPLRPGNQVDNPGFENPGDRSWHLNNWFTGPNGQTNVAEAAVDTNGPHAGTCCARITMSRHIGGDVQFQQKLPRLQPGGVYELRFWTRGTSNTKPVTVWVLKHDAPYTKYLFGQVSCGDTWAESVMRVVLPTHAPVDGIGLWFSMGDEGTFWLDDISLTALPAVEAGEPLAGNRVANGSFETGHDRWYADIHGPGGRSGSGADYSPAQSRIPRYGQSEGSGRRAALRP